MKKAVVIAVALVLSLAACGKNKESAVDLSTTTSSPGATNEAKASGATGATPKATTAGKTTTSGGAATQTTGPTPRPAAQGGQNLPKDGTYTYRVDGSRSDPMNPAGGEQKFSNETVTDKQTHQGNVYTDEITGSTSSGRTTTKTQWEQTRILLLSTKIEQAFGTFSCEYNPDPVIAHLPIKPEKFPQQKLSGSGNSCGGTLDIEVLRKDTAKDANGKSWSVWVVHVVVNSSFTYNGQPVKAHTDDMRYISPDIGKEIRSQSSSSSEFGNPPQKNTAHVTSALKSYP